MPVLEPTYYYYTGVLCGGSTIVPFRSTDPSLADHCSVVQLFCGPCGDIIECFDNISPSAIPNSNDLIDCFDSCELCYTQPSPTPTTTQTPTPTFPCSTCYQYQFGPAIASGTVMWTNCDNTPDSQFVNIGNTLTITCAKDGTVTGIGPVVKVSTCGAPCITPTPTLTTTPSQTPNPTTTPTQTPTLTKTPTQTPTLTSTQTPTPSVTRIGCGLGLTNGSYYYTDCCGNFIQGTTAGLTVSMDYSKTFFGITKLNTSTTQVCPTPNPTTTPSQTPTQTLTPTNTPTFSPTPSLTKTPTPTPSNKPAVRLANNCDLFTLFDMGVNCYVVSQPSSSISNDGIISVKVTGGTSPYSFYWSNGQRNQTLVGVSQGSYICTVVDYYGDYTATTICSLIAPTAAPSPTQTITPTITPSGTCPKLCFLAYNSTQTYGLWQFTCNGTYKGRTTWTYAGDINIVWDGTRWVLTGPDMTTPFVTEGGGIFVSTTTANIPLASWTTLGDKSGSNYVISVTEGNCPANIPLQTKVTFEDSTCNGTQNCNGNITIATRFGVPPYGYSINNGTTWQNSNFFFNLCPNTYTVITRDSTNNTVSDIVKLGYSQSPTTYQLSVNLLSDLTQTINGQNTTSKTTYFSVTANPPIPIGTTLNFYLNFSSIKTINGPGTGTITDNIKVYQNGTQLNAVDPLTTTTLGTRPDCSPESQTATTESESYYCELSSSKTVTGSTQSILDVNNGQISTNNCVTQLNQKINVGFVKPVINGCSCCTVVADNNPFPVIENTISYVKPTVPPSCVTCQGVIQQGTGIFLNTNVLVGGLICTSPLGVGCFQNFRYCAAPSPSCILTDNGVVSSLECGINPNSNVKYVTAYFQVNANGFYNITADAYLNNVKVGTGLLNAYLYDNTNPMNDPKNSIYITMTNPINIQLGDVFKIVYYKTPNP